MSPAKKRKLADRSRITTPTGTTFTLVDRGDRGWQLDVKLPGLDRVRELVGRGDRDEAARRAVARVQEIERHSASAGSPTLARVAAELIVAKEKEGRAPGYLRKFQEHWWSYIQPHFGPDVPIAAITAADLLAFKKALGDGDLSPKSCNRILTTVRQIFKFAEDPSGYCVAPALPRSFEVATWQAPERWHLLQPAEVARVLSHAPAEARDLFGYLGNTGVRIGTALATEESWIDWRARSIHYPASAMKGRHPHTVELNAAAEMYLRHAVDVSPGRPFPYAYWYYLKRWIATREAAGVPGVRIHDLRHSFVSNQLDAGTPIHVVRDLAAHRSLSVTALYAHGTDEARRMAADRVQIVVPETPQEAEVRVTTVSPKQNRRAVTRRNLVPRDGVEPPTRGFSVPCSTS
jgi:integrase